MNGSIKVSMDYDTNQTVIRIVRDKSSTDERDRMLNNFLEKASNPESILYTTFSNKEGEDVVEIRCEMPVASPPSSVTQNNL